MVRLRTVTPLGDRTPSMVHGTQMQGLNVCSTLLAVAVIGCLFTPAQASDKKQEVRFGAGEDSATIKGSLKGYDTNRYLFGATAGQVMSIQLKPSNLACYFNVFVPNTHSAISHD